MNFDDVPISKSKKNKKNKKKLDDSVYSETHTEPVEDNVAKRKKKHKQATHNLSSHHISEAADAKFGKKKLKQEMNNNDSPVKEVDKSISSIETSPEGSKKKKRKSSLMDGDRSLHVEGHISDDDVSMLSVFQTPAKKLKIREEEQMVKEEHQKLLSLAMEQVKPERISFTRRWSSLNFAKIAEEFEDKSAEDCEIQLKILIESITKKKCLHQLLQETLNDLPEKKPNSTSFTNFIHLSMEQIDEQLKRGELGKTRLTVAANMWKAMSLEEKRAFIPDKRKTSKLDGQSAFEVYWVNLKNKNCDISNKDARLKWAELKFVKKIKYIKKSAKMMKYLLAEREDDKQGSKKVKGPTKDEIVQILEHAEVPKEPSKSVSVYYYTKKHSDPSQDDRRNVLMKAIKSFNELSTEKQGEWMEKHKKAQKRFERSLEEWKANQDDVMLFIFKLFKETKAEKKKDKELRSPIRRSLKFVEMPIRQIKFSSEPIKPPLTPLSLFAREHKKNTGEKLSSQKARAGYFGLDSISKLTFKSKVKKIREVYIEGLKDYVDDMGDEQRRLFLGLKRVGYIKLFSDDIFEASYPNKDYPAYSQPPVKRRNENKEENTVVKNKVKNKVKVSKLEPEDEEEEMEEEEEDDDDDDEEEEEEEEELPVLSPPKHKKPRDYTSRKASTSKAPGSLSKKKADAKINRKATMESDESESEDDEISYAY